MFLTILINLLTVGLNSSSALDLIYLSYLLNTSFLWNITEWNYTYTNIFFTLNLFLAHTVIYLAISCTRLIFQRTFFWQQPQLLGAWDFTAQRLHQTQGNI